MRLLQQPLESHRIVEEIKKYNPADAQAVSSYIRQEAALSKALEQCLTLYRQVLAEKPLTKSRVAEEVGDYARSMTLWVGALERELAEWRQPYRMEPLTKLSCFQLGLRSLGIPERVERNRRFEAKVELENQSTVMLGSFPPCPLHLCYRWLAPDSNEIVVEEGPRTTINPSLFPGHKASFKIRVTAPSNPGQYRLRLTLVQEWVRWFDQIEPPLILEALLLVE